MTSLTRGPLAPGVYWRRRMALLGIVLLLVLGVSRMFGGGDGEDPSSRAANVSAPVTTSPSATPSASPSDTPAAGVSVAPTPTPTPTSAPTPTLPEPTGRCSDDDITVTPSVTDAQATKTVIVRLTLRTVVTTACTWRASSKSLQLKITSGSDRIWSTVDCPHAIASQDIVVRRDSDAILDVAWNSRRSDEDCSKHTQWAMPGYYHVTVAALGGEPQDLQFPLRKPRPDPTPTPTPTPAATATAAATTAAPATGARQEPQSDPVKKRKKKYWD